MNKPTYNIEALLQEIKTRSLTDFEKEALLKDARFLQEYISESELELKSLPDRQLVEKVYDAMCDYSN